MPKTTVPARSRRASGAPAGRKRTLSRDQIVAAAIEVIDLEGPQALSLHKVAARLSVYPTTIYTYFETVDGLRDAAQWSLLQEVPLPSSTDRAPLREQVIRYFEGLRRLYHRHPGFLKVEIGSTSWFEGLRHMNEFLAAVTRAGVDLERAWVIFRVGEGLAISSAQLARSTTAENYVRAQKEALLGHEGGGLETVRRLLDLDTPNLPPAEGFHRLLEQALHGLLPGKR
ncbi:MAG: TetR/AcrR family transcriptional regulator [Nevskia sp.]|nr:TetR/AcrR family transcriptional regulator [Nevskia sp.]